jgi:signal transduction histidine kinase/ActR/RegA family two-component response regulator
VTSDETARRERRVLLLTPTARDAGLTAQLLEHEGIDCEVCVDLPTLCRHLEQGAGALLLPEEEIGPQRPAGLLRILARQAPWSDLPILVLARTGADSAGVAQAMDLLGNVTVVERPTRMSALLSAVRTALRARQRQYQIREHLAERARAEAALREGDRRKDEFLAILAHELRNPLAPIRNSVHILRATKVDDPTVQSVTEMMERQVNQMVRLVDDLLEISRITRGKIELKVEPVELRAVLESAVETCRPSIEAAGHSFAVSLPEGPVLLHADPVRLAQVFTNLLNNACKYTDAGGSIGLTARREGNEAIVEVADNGRGIPSHMLERIFDLFTQVDGATERSPGGLGIGLTLARTLVESHGGSLDAHSLGAGKGSRFVVRLPVLKAGRPAPNGGGDRPAADLSARRILVVDDNRDAADSLAMVLGLLGAEVRTEYDGGSGLATARAWSPSVVFLDIGMAHMDGHEVARRIRQDPDLAGVQLVALTGWGQDKDRRDSREAGFDHHLTKPVDIGVLQMLLQSLEAPRPA